MSVVQVQINFTIQETPEEHRHYIGSKDWELIDPDGDRHGFADTEQEARDMLHDLVFEWLYSSSFSITEGE